MDGQESTPIAGTDFGVFTALVGQRFELQVGEGVPVLVAELVEATPLKSPPGRGRTPFSLVFRGPMQPVLEQRTYRFVHSDGRVPDMDIFIVPVSMSGQGVSYEAVFN